MSVLDDDIERRLQNWGRWRGGGLDYATANAEATFDGYGSGSRGYRETRMPVLAGEALDTDRRIQRLAGELQLVLYAHYARIILLGSGTSVRASHYWRQEELARECALSLRTFERRLADARAAVAVLLRFRRP